MADRMDNGQSIAKCLSEMFSQTKTELTDMEASLWINEIERLGMSAFLSFTAHWMSRDHPRSPKVEDFRQFGDPEYVNADIALERLAKDAGEIGPYEDPQLNDRRLVAAVLHLGGWVKVCETMPSQSEEFAWKRFAERFKLAWSRGEAQVAQGRLPPGTQLRGFVEIANETQLLIESAPAPVQGGA